MAVVNSPIIPTNITVHLGGPNQKARNVTVPFIEYIKDVASNEVYPTWPTDAIKANVLAQISFALNRIYNEWYPSQGYDFDITSSPSYDQAYKENGQYFETISEIVDEIFNNYIVRTGQIQPLYAQYCDGKNVKCNGLSQWGSVSLAEQGKSPLEILKYYYGNDIKLVYNAEVEDNISTYPGFPLELGSVGTGVEQLKIQLNRISQNYPAIPIISDQNRFFTVELENSVKAFQKIFNLPQNGIVDKSTWYKIKYIYNAVKKISDLYSEGIQKSEATYAFPLSIKKGERGPAARAINYLLTVISYFDDKIPLLTVTDTFNDNTESMLKAFQKEYNLPETGLVNADVWKKLNDVYIQTINTIPTEYLVYVDEFFPGRFLSIGFKGDDVTRLQKFLYTICKKYKSIPGVRVTGVFDDLTKQSVEAIQRRFNQEVNGVVGPYVWYLIVEYSKGNIK